MGTYLRTSRFFIIGFVVLSLLLGSIASYAGNNTLTLEQRVEKLEREVKSLRHNLSKAATQTDLSNASDKATSQCNIDASRAVNAATRAEQAATRAEQAANSIR